MLINAGPSILNISNTKGIKAANVDSNNVTPKSLLDVMHQDSAAVADPYAQNVVIVHGPDTLDEMTSFYSQPSALGGLLSSLASCVSSQQGT